MENFTDFYNSLDSIIRELRQNEILLHMFDNVSVISNNGVNDYFIIPMKNPNNNSISYLVIDARNLYIQGYIRNNHYYHFRPRNADDVILNSITDNTISNINNPIISEQLPFEGNYGSQNGLIPNSQYSWYINILPNLQTLFEDNVSINRLQRAFIGISLAISESIRFQEIRNLITNCQNEEGTSWVNTIEPIIKNWSKSTKSIAKEVKQKLFKPTTSAIFTNEEIANELKNLNILSDSLILTLSGDFLIILLECFSGYLKSKRQRPKRDLTDTNDIMCYVPYLKKDTVKYYVNFDKEIYKTFEKENHCEILKVNEIQGKVTAIKIIDENTKGGNFKPGDIYIGTTQGVYCFTEGKYINKFYDLNFTIASITLDGNGSAYVINNDKKLFRLNLNGWGHSKIDKDDFQVNVLKVLNTTPVNNNWIKKYAIYIGTNKGVYFVNGDQIWKDEPEIVKFDGLNFPITSIELDGIGNAYVTNEQNEIYHLNLCGWGYEKVNKHLHDELRKRRDVFDISKLDDKKDNNQTIIVNEFKNTAPWKKNITNLINDEQHLPIINNVTNYNMTNGAA